MTSYDIKKFLKKYSEITTPILRSYFQKKINEASKIGKTPVDLLEKFAVMNEKGKKIRGALVVLGYLLAGGREMPAIYDVSTFSEILHTGLLVHDDIMDQDDLRRGMPSIPKQFGESLAICIGDLAFYLSWDKLLNSNFPEDKLIKTSKIYAKFASNVVYGQTLDLVNNIQSNYNQKEILNIFRFKTAEYTGYLPLLIGATLGGMEKSTKLKALEEYGLNLGWAFQIQDDILGIFGNQELTGKPLGSDIKEGKNTLMVHYVLKKGNISEINYLKSVLGNRNLKFEDILKTQIFFKNTGAYDHVVNLGRKYVEKGKKVITLLTDDKKLQKILESLIIYVMNRVV